MADLAGILSALGITPPTAPAPRPAQRRGVLAASQTQASPVASIPAIPVPDVTPLAEPGSLSRINGAKVPIGPGRAFTLPLDRRAGVRG